MVVSLICYCILIENITIILLHVLSHASNLIRKRFLHLAYQTMYSGKHPVTAQCNFIPSKIYY